MDAKLALKGGAGGALALTLLHETTRRIVPKAPRLDLLGMQAVARLFEGAGKKTPSEKKLFYLTLAGDLAANALFFAVAGAGKVQYVLVRGLLLGLASGAGAVILPKPLGLSAVPVKRSAATEIMTVAFYTAGGLVAGWLMKRKKAAPQVAGGDANIRCYMDARERFDD